MKKYTLILIPAILILFYLYSIMIVGAADQCEFGNVSTTSGNHVPNSTMHPPSCTCSGAKPIIVSSSTTISAEEPITLWVDSGGQACPTFSWQVSGTGYHLDKSETHNDLEVVTLTCDPGTWGTDYAATCTVSITDNCENSDSVTLRNTDGKWGNEVIECMAGGTVNYNWYLAIGGRRYHVEIDRGGDYAVKPPNDCSIASHCAPYMCNEWKTVYGYSQCIAANGGLVCCERTLKPGYCVQVPGFSCSGTIWSADITGAKYQDWTCK